MNQDSGTHLSGQNLFKPIESELPWPCEKPPVKSNAVLQYGEPNISLLPSPSTDLSVPSQISLEETSKMEEDGLSTQKNSESGDCCAYIISPYPYSPSPQELEERHLLTKQLGSDWSISEAVTSDEDEDQRRTGSASPSPGTINYSEYFFDNLPPTDDISEPHGDEISFIFDDETIYEEDEDMSMTEPVSKSIWEEGTVVPDEVYIPSERALSPAQVSVGSAEENEEKREGTLSSGK